VTVLLPVPALSGDPAAPDGDAALATPRVEPDRSLLAGLRILVVEDEADSREIISTVLREWGADVAAAASARDALRALDDGRTDVLVSDIGMPEMDGYELIRAVRKRSRRAGGEVPAIALTAYAEPESRQTALDAGYDEHVPKPAEPRQLMQAVARLAGRRPPPSA